MPSARVKFFHKTRGFGFLRTADGVETFFHVSDWRANEDDLIEGMLVDYEPSTSRNGKPCAIQVRTAGEAPDGASLSSVFPDR